MKAGEASFALEAEGCSKTCSMSSSVGCDLNCLSRGCRWSRGQCLSDFVEAGTHFNESCPTEEGRGCNFVPSTFCRTGLSQPLLGRAMSGQHVLVER